MSHQTTGRRLGRGVAMFSQFLFYTLPPVPLPFDCGLCGLPFRDASGREPVPADNGASRQRPAYTTWAGLSGTTTGTPEAP